MANRLKNSKITSQSNIVRKIRNWSICILLIKFIITFNIPAHLAQLGTGENIIVKGIWPGSDAENYLMAYLGLIKDGVFSSASSLNYFPAGYPLFIYLLSFFGKSWVFITLPIVQSTIFSFAAYLFATQLAKTRLQKYSYLVFLFIILNPTLSLYSLIIGYESLAASGFLIVLALITKDLVEKNEKNFFKYLVINSLVIGFISFLQPRLIVSGIILYLVWILSRRTIKIASYMVALTLLLTLFFPATLVFRNNKAIGENVISTNLGGTMMIGAGDKATGGYVVGDTGIKCDTTGSVSEQDSQRVRCAIDWYLSNPEKLPKLFFNKTIYFWSPWSGPLGNGTMARNPWLEMNPIQQIIYTPDGNRLVFGSFGKLISWVWIFGGLMLMVYGYLVIWRQRGIEQLIASLALSAIVLNTAISLVTIGDHRFRLPIMGLSLFLQAIGLKTLLRGGRAQMVDQPRLR